MSSRLTQIQYITTMALREAKWLLGDHSPFAATIKLTSRCTLRCGHCPWTDTSTPDMPFEKVKEIIETLRGRGVCHLVLEGGEPTLRDDLQDIIAFAQSKKMTVMVATNCTRSLAPYTPDCYFVSVDGLQQTHDKMRGTGAFDKLMSNLPTARSSRVALISLCRSNVTEIEEVLRFFAPRLEGFWFSFIYDYSGKNTLALGTEEKKEAARRILALRDSYPIINKPSFLKRVGTPRPCRDWMLYTVTSEGIIHPGCMVKTVDTCRCDECELACHRETSDLSDVKYILYNLWAYFRSHAIWRRSAGPRSSDESDTKRKTG